MCNGLIAMSWRAAGGGIKQQPGLPGDGGYSLHAERLQFAHPTTGHTMTVEATPPPELQTHSELVTASAASSVESVDD